MSIFILIVGEDFLEVAILIEAYELPELEKTRSVLIITHMNYGFSLFLVEDQSISTVPCTDQMLKIYPSVNLTNWQHPRPFLSYSHFLIILGA